MDKHNSTDTSATAQRAVASGPLVRRHLLERCAQAIRDLDRITPHPLSAEEQARAVLDVVCPQRPSPADCRHTEGFWQFEGETYCRTCGENEERCKPNTKGSRAEERE